MDQLPNMLMHRRGCDLYLGKIGSDAALRIEVTSYSSDPRKVMTAKVFFSTSCACHTGLMLMVKAKVACV